MLKDYQVRFLDEYKELYKKYTALDLIIKNYEDEVLEFELTCPVALLRRQRKLMKEYLGVLEERAQIEGLVDYLKMW